MGLNKSKFPLLDLPDDMIMEITGKLKRNDVLNLMLTCQRLKDICHPIFKSKNKYVIKHFSKWFGSIKTLAKFLNASPGYNSDTPCQYYIARYITPDEQLG